jgi:hypothetical protein
MGIIKKIATLVLFVGSFQTFAQLSGPNIDTYKPDPKKEAMYLTYLAVRHGGIADIEKWKQSNTVLYYKELWYYSESFSVKRNYLAEGVKMDEAGIDISRYENSRKENEEVVLILPGYKDVLVLLPSNRLIFKPDYLK